MYYSNAFAFNNAAYTVRRPAKTRTKHISGAFESWRLHESTFFMPPPKQPPQDLRTRCAIAAIAATALRVRRAPGLGACGGQKETTIVTEKALNPNVGRFARQAWAAANQF